MKLFLHCCCGPCAVGSIPQFTAAGYEPYCWFYNPNIQPFQEHKARRLAFVELMEQLGLEYAVDPEYPLEEMVTSCGGASGSSMRLLLSFAADSCRSRSSPTRVLQLFHYLVGESLSGS